MAALPDYPVDPARPDPSPGPSPIPSDEDTLVEVIQDVTWWALGQPKPHRIYMSIQGDWWDLICIRVYGRTRGNEHLMYRLLEENWPLKDVGQFPAGIPVVVPEVAVAAELQLVPWKKASQVI